jgi:hypothetical protein
MNIVTKEFVTHILKNNKTFLIPSLTTCTSSVSYIRHVLMPGQESAKNCQMLQFINNYIVCLISFTVNLYLLTSLSSYLANVLIEFRI